MGPQIACIRRCIITLIAFTWLFSTVCMLKCALKWPTPDKVYPHCLHLVAWWPWWLFWPWNLPGISLLGLVSKNLDNWEEKENCFQNIINREEKLIYFLKILKVQEEKENLVSESHKSRKEREFFLKILKIEKRKKMGSKISEIEKVQRIFLWTSWKSRL